MLQQPMIYSYFSPFIAPMGLCCWVKIELKDFWLAAVQMTIRSDGSKDGILIAFVLSSRRCDFASFHAAICSSVRWNFVPFLAKRLNGAKSSFKRGAISRKYIMNASLRLLSWASVGGDNAFIFSIFSLDRESFDWDI